MSDRESTTEVIAFKQRILQEAPASGRMIEGVDKIFYMKEPGEDATLSGSGTVTFREGWGTSPRPTRYGGVIAADKALRQKGYRPYNIFTGNEWQMNEQRHKIAKFDRQRQQEVFQQVELPKITKQSINEQRYNRAPEFEYPSMDMPTQQPRSQRERSGPMNYFDLLQDLPDPVADIRKTKGLIMRQTIDDNQFAGWSNQKFSALKSMERQLGIPSVGAASRQKASKRKSSKRKTTNWAGKQ